MAQYRADAFRLRAEGRETYPGTPSSSHVRAQLDAHRGLIRQESEINRTSNRITSLLKTFNDTESKILKKEIKALNNLWIAQTVDLTEKLDQSALDLANKSDLIHQQTLRITTLEVLEQTSQFQQLATLKDEAHLRDLQIFALTAERDGLETELKALRSQCSENTMTILEETNDSFDLSQTKSHPPKKLSPRAWDQPLPILSYEDSDDEVAISPKIRTTTPQHYKGKMTSLGASHSKHMRPIEIRGTASSCTQTNARPESKETASQTSFETKETSSQIVYLEVKETSSQTEYSVNEETSTQTEHSKTATADAQTESVETAPIGTQTEGCQTSAVETQTTPRKKQGTSTQTDVDKETAPTVLCQDIIKDLVNIATQAPIEAQEPTAAPVEGSLKVLRTYSKTKPYVIVNKMSAEDVSAQGNSSATTQETQAKKTPKLTNKSTKETKTESRKVKGPKSAPPHQQQAFFLPRKVKNPDTWWAEVQKLNPHIQGVATIKKTRGAGDILVPRHLDGEKALRLPFFYEGRYRSLTPMDEGRYVKKEYLMTDTPFRNPGVYETLKNLKGLRSIRVLDSERPWGGLNFRGRIVLTFYSDIVPSFISTKSGRRPLHTYAGDNPRCTKCQRFGHLQDACRARQPTCALCSRDHWSSECYHKKRTGSEIKHKCANCHGEHSAAYKGCPSYRKATEANRAPNKAQPVAARDIPTVWDVRSRYHYQKRVTHYLLDIYLNECESTGKEPEMKIINEAMEMTERMWQ